MLGYEDRLLAHYGYLETKGCAQATLCPALSLPDLFCSARSRRPTAARGLTAASINSLLAAVPPYFSQAVITRDHREATLAFGIRLMPLARQQRVIDYMRSQLHPPPGVDRAARRAAGARGARPTRRCRPRARRLLTLLAGLVAVGAGAAGGVPRSRARALVPLVPIALATGWSALILFLIGIPLNPMSATLGALVIAISTEFSVLLSERFRQERAAGHDLRPALRADLPLDRRRGARLGDHRDRRLRRAVFSNITMLRDFGFVTADRPIGFAGRRAAGAARGARAV